VTAPPAAMPMCSGLHSFAGRLALIALIWLTLAQIIKDVWLALDRLLATFDDSGLDPRRAPQGWAATAAVNACTRP